MSVFALEDLFTVGLGFDIAGAYLLAKGLLATPSEIAKQRTFGYYSYNAPDTVAAARDRVDGSIGMRALLLGFLLQAVGYAIGLATASNDEDGSLLRALVGIILCGLAIAAVLVYWRLRRPKAVKSLLVDVSCCDPAEPAMLKPSVQLLVAFGKELGYTLQPGEATPEGQSRYTLRVFGVGGDDVRPAQEHAE